LYGVARNVTRACLRRERRFVSLEELCEDESGPAGHEDPASALARSQDLVRLRGAIVSLPSQYREIVILCDLHGVSYADAAGIIAAPVGTVRSRLHRGRGLLLERLRGREQECSRTVVRRVSRCLT
jgi:RNA polymerase sigma-70 factor (ECF subfamily)